MKVHPRLPWLTRLATLFQPSFRPEGTTPGKDPETEASLLKRLDELEQQNGALRAELEELRQLKLAAASECKAHELALVRAKEQAEQSSRNKSAFLSNMSHEIRTPMTSVVGFAELLSLDETSPERRRGYVEKILRNSRHLLALIDNILDLSKIEAGQLVPDRATFSPASAMAQAVDLIKDQAEAKGLHLTIEYQDPLPQTIVSDPLRFRQILMNLLGNAVKFTERGTITVSARQNTGSHLLQIDVQDTGVGIKPSLQPALFQPFSQISTSGTRLRPGAGLGLTLARNIARSLGGDVVLGASSEGLGSTFSVTLPLDLPTKAKTSHG